MLIAILVSSLHICFGRTLNANTVTWSHKAKVCQPVCAQICEWYLHTNGTRKKRANLHFLRRMLNIPLPFGYLNSHLEHLSSACDFCLFFSIIFFCFLEVSWKRISVSYVKIFKVPLRVKKKSFQFGYLQILLRDHRDVFLCFAFSFFLLVSFVIKGFLGSQVNKITACWQDIWWACQVDLS